MIEMNILAVLPAILPAIPAILSSALKMAAWIGGITLAKKMIERFSDTPDGKDIALELKKESIKIQAESLEQQQAGQAEALEQTISYFKQQDADNKLREEMNFHSRTNASLEQTMIQSLGGQLSNQVSGAEILAAGGQSLIAAGSQPRQELGFRPQTIPTVTEGINPLSPNIIGF